MKRIIYTLALAFGLLASFTSCKEKDMSMKMNNPRNIKGVISYKRSFGDLNDTHLAAARKIGVSPLQNREAAEKLGNKVVEIKSGDLYQVDSLTHSIPFLVPKASALLDSIGANFLDSLESKGLNPNQVIVTSVLRTYDDVKRLGKRNINASKNSAHVYGTTFDITYKRFFKVEDPDGRPMQDVRADTLKLVLSEVLRDLKKKEMCYVKYELKQACFHITAR
ncbi:MAG: hypothetical protein IJY59_11105 [Bacteroidaceae bacterium]|nr:hypothetical protein [Bacteroidaceae bacterium]